MYYNKYKNILPFCFELDNTVFIYMLSYHRKAAHQSMKQCISNVIILTSGAGYRTRDT